MQCIDNPDSVFGAWIWTASRISNPETVALVVCELDAAMVIVVTEMPARINRVIGVPDPTTKAFATEAVEKLAPPPISEM
jgi:hypothetical protein